MFAKTQVLIVNRGMTTLRRVLKLSGDQATGSGEDVPSSPRSTTKSLVHKEEIKPPEPEIANDNGLAITAVPATTEQIKKITWVQCDTCQKWRKLPPDVEVLSEEVWTCNMNEWAPNGGSCDDPEDAEDPVIAIDPVPAAALITQEVLLATSAAVVVPQPTPPPAAAARERRTAASVAPPAPVTYAAPLAPLLPPGINLYGEAFRIPPLGKQSRIVSYRDLISSHYRNNKTFNPHYDHICDVRYAAFSAYTSPTVHEQAAHREPPRLFPVHTKVPDLQQSRLPPKKRHHHHTVGQAETGE